MKQLSNMKEFPISKAFQFIEPGPVVLVSTAQKGQRPNIMTMSWHMVMDFTPQFACIIGPWDFTFKALSATKECVIAIPTVDMIGKVIEIGNYSGKDIDKFKSNKLTPLPARNVQAPLIAECLANIECRVVDTVKVNKYSMFILKGINAWIDTGRKERRTFHAQGDGTFAVDGRILDYRKKMLKLP
jgi:flavin reductase (DIM6/NTAB) family NADH-FMN oxidoreductase RutF